MAKCREHRTRNYGSRIWEVSAVTNKVPRISSAIVPVESTTYYTMMSFGILCILTGQEEEGRINRINKGKYLSS